MLKMKATTQFDPVESGQHQIQNDKVGLLAAGNVECTESIRFGGDHKALAAESVGDGVGDGRVVFHHKDPFHATEATGQPVQRSRAICEDIVQTRGVEP